jgi:ketosteroid isomerase-like protein
MKTVNVILVTGMVIFSSALLAQTKGGMPFTSSSDLAKAKLKYPAPSDKDKQEIKDIINASSSAYLKGDVDAVLTYYSDQAIELYPNQMINAATGNIRNRLKERFKYGSFTKMDRTVESIEGTGPIAMALCKTKSAFKSSSDGKIYDDYVDDIFLFRRQEDGQWKILVRHWFPNNVANGQPSDDSVSIRQLINKWSFFIKPGEVLSQEHVENYVANYSSQAVEIPPNQWSNIGIANIRLRNTGNIGMTWAQCTGYTFDINSFVTIGAKGFSRRAVAWGIGDHSNYPEGSDKLSQDLFPWAMILTKEKDTQWRILVYHFYLD